MPQLLIALVVLIGGLWIIRKAGRLQPSQVRSFSSRIVGGGAMALAGFLAFRGNMQLAVPIFVFGAGLLGFSQMPAGGFRWPGAEKSAGQKSTVATSLLSMELDHDSGEMQGRVLKGPFAKRKLSDLSEDELKSFHQQCVKEDRQGAQLLEAWLDRNKADWRSSWSANGGRSRSSGGMTRDEAFSLLGLKEGASDDDIRAAHRRLMKDYHPDKGGTDYLAAKINEAKDVLLGV